MKVKEGVDIGDLEKVSANLLFMLGWVANWCDVNQQECTVTSLIREQSPQSRSTTHADGRAADIRVKSWTQAMRAKLEKDMYNDPKIVKMAAISGETGQPRPIYIHESFDTKGRVIKDNNNNVIYHAHIQCRR